MSLVQALKEEHLKLILVCDELSSSIRGHDALIAVSKVVAPSCKTLVIIETEVSLYQSNKDFWKKAINFSNENINIKRYGFESTRPNHDLEILKKDIERSFDTSTLCIISSITPLALSHSWASLARFLACLSESPKLSRLIVNLHTDCHPLDHQDYAKLENFQRCVPDLLLTTLPESSGPNAMLRVKKTGQKSKISQLRISFDENFNMSENQFKRLAPEIRKAEECQETTDLASTIQTTFRLELGESELAAKSQVKLPFWKTDSSIDYIPDEGDDWDEEDPDDDLNF